MRIGPTLWLGAALTLLCGSNWHRARHFVRVDSCLDRGGAYDYEREACITDGSGPPTFRVISYRERFPAQARVGVVGTWATLVGGIAAILVARRAPPLP